LVGDGSNVDKKTMDQVINFSKLGLFKLSDFVGGRDNNFNLMRLIAAIMVLYGHSFVLAVGASSAEPWLQLGISPGSVAVDVFFVTSGFLVTGSLIERKELCSFVIARMLRIYPALLIVVALTVLVLGAYFSTLSIGAYISEGETFKYWVKNSTLLSGSYGYLPEVFENNPFKKAVNGSLWTMPWEVKMYIVLLGVGIVAKFAHWKDWVWKTLVISVFVGMSALYLLTYIFDSLSLVKDVRVLRLFFMFFAGASFFALKDRIYIGHSIGLIAFLCTSLSLLVGKSLFLPVYTIAVGYIVLYLAFLPKGKVRNFNKLGDYSYGVYIYAFPIQQTIVALMPRLTGIELFFMAFPCVLICSMLSWHYVEKRCLRLKNKRILCGQSHT
jgi:peptidoglycan/LPS O-acetylase OafA/YrhL